MYTKNKNSKELEENQLKKEAKAFDKRILLRARKGFVPDLRKLKVNQYFYKSFWRDPLFVDLYLLEIYRNFKLIFGKFAKNKKKILDIGCGSGYFSLELARDGFDVTGVDISKKCIEIAEKTARGEQSNLKGNLSYMVADHNDLKFEEKFDIIMSSGFLHHLSDLNKFTKNANNFLKKKGILVWHEPQHKDWKLQDAAIVSSLRLVLSNLGYWFENLDKKKIFAYTKEVYDEFYFERDKKESSGQSPNDLSCDKKEILKEVSKDFEILLTKPSFAFIYRFLGGLRGQKKNIHSLAKLLYRIDKDLVDNNIINANYFFGVAKKK